MSDNGFVQGGLFGSPGYSLLDAFVRRRVRETHTNVHFINVIDDTHIVGQPDAALAAAAEYIRLRREMMGVNNNDSKTKIFTYNTALPENYETSIDTHLQGARVLSTDDDLERETVFGVPLSSNPDTVAALMLAKVKRGLDNLDDDRITPFNAIAAIRQGLTPTLTYILRALPPSLTAKGAAAIDDKISSLILRKLDAADDTTPDLTARNRALNTIFLPARDGGIGIKSLADIAAPAFTAGTINSAFIFTADNNTQHADVLKNTTYLNNLANAIRRIASYEARGIDSAEATIPITASQFRNMDNDDLATLLINTYTAAASPPRRLQRKLTCVVERKKLDDLLADADEYQAARIASQKGGKWSALHLANPDTPLLAVDVQKFYLRLAVGLPAFNNMPTSCCLAKPHDPSLDTLSILKHRGKFAQGRHNAVRDAIVAALKPYVPMLTEQIVPTPGDTRSRTDMTLLHSSVEGGLAFDVSIVTPRTGTTGYAARQMRLAKHRKYDAHFAAHAHYTFVPLVFETTGYADEEAIAGLRRLVFSSQVKMPLEQRQRFLQSLIAKIQAEIQIWNYAQASQMTAAARLHAANLPPDHSPPDNHDDDDNNDGGYDADDDNNDGYDADDDNSDDADDSSGDEPYDPLAVYMPGSPMRLPTPDPPSTPPPSPTNRNLGRAEVLNDQQAGSSASDSMATTTIVLTITTPTADTPDGSTSPTIRLALHHVTASESSDDLGPAEQAWVWTVNTNSLSISTNGGFRERESSEEMSLYWGPIGPFGAMLQNFPPPGPPGWVSDND